MYLLTTAIIIAACLAVFVGLRRTLKRTSAELRLEFQRQVDSLAARVAVLEQEVDAPAAPAATSTAEAQAADEITPETLATIAETVAALLGRKVQIRSVKILPVPDAIANPWAQRGRAIVQASHDFSQRSRP
ncbi:MAG: hypothetical protein ABSB14_05520 [Candidatus Sulfotelmatobacter sp.]